MSEPVLMRTSGAVMILTMNRPDKKNALTDEMYGLLADHLETAENERAVRAILICGEGDLFTAGNDIADFAAAGNGEEEVGKGVGRFLTALAVAAKPLVAAVQGKAVGVGTTMLLHCDQVVLAENAVLMTPFVNLGLVPEAASSLLLPERIGHVRAFAMLAMGQPVGAADALAWGLASAVVPLEELQSHAQAVAAGLARQPLDAVMATKKLMRGTKDILARMDVEAGLFAERLQSAEAKEAFAAFAERRAPDFSKLP